MQISHREAARALKNLGFTKDENGKGTSHEQWRKDFPGENPARRKVTLDKHNSPYCKALLSSIIKQAGVSKKEFIKAAKI